MHGFLGKKRHDVSSDISSFHSIEAHKQDGLYHWTTRASNSTVYKQYHSNPTDFENQMICPPNGPCREALVPQVGGSQEPWRPKASQEMVKRGFHFGRDAIQHGIRVCTKTRSIFIAEHLIYDKFSVIRVGILFGKKGIACHLHVSCFQRPILYMGYRFDSVEKNASGNILKSWFHQTPHAICHEYMYTVYDRYIL